MRQKKEDNKARERNLEEQLAAESSANQELQVRFASKSRGCLHEKTRTGANSIPEWLLDFVSRLHEGTAGLHHMSSVAYTTPFWRDWCHTEASGRFSPEWNSRSGTATEVTSRRYDSLRYGILWWYHVNEYKATRRNWGEVAPVWKSPRYHVNTS